MSKGSAVRPRQVSDEQYAQRWDLIFGRDKEVVVEDEQEQKKEKDENLDLG
jgi:hypothetical protein